jgi:hypothetical protein
MHDWDRRIQELGELTGPAKVASPDLDRWVQVAALIRVGRSRTTAIWIVSDTSWAKGFEALESRDIRRGCAFAVLRLRSAFSLPDLQSVAYCPGTTDQANEAEQCAI